MVHSFTMRFSAVLSFTLGLGAVVAAHGDDDSDACLPDWEVCSKVQPVVDVLLGISDVKHICQQLDPDAVGPVTVTITDSPQASTTTTVFQTVTNPVEVTSLVTKTITQSSQAIVTRRFSSSAVQSVRVTVPATALQTIPITSTQLITQTVTATLTNTATITTTKTATDLETATVTVTASAVTKVMPQRKAARDASGLLASYPADELRDACWCLETATVSETVTLPTVTKTSTVTLATAVAVTSTITETADATAQVTGTATVDVTSVVTEVSVITTTATTTVQVTAVVTLDQEVDVTATATATVTAEETASVTTTEVATVTATVTPTATCGVNLIQNPNFDSLTLPPWTVTKTGAASQLYNSNCGISPYCLLDYSTGAGSVTLAQTVDTVAGVTYAVSFKYHVWSAPITGTSLTCSVNNSAGTSWSPSLSVSTSTWASFSGSFVASGSQTIFTCVGAATSSLWLNLARLTCSVSM